MTPREETGLGSLYDYNARFYSPVLGRFLSADTIVPDASDPQSLNRFSYTRNNPVNRIDPSGHADALSDDGGIGDPIIRRRMFLDTVDRIETEGYQHHTTWNRLNPVDRELLTRNGWDQRNWNIENVTGNATDVSGTFEDPLTYVELALGARAVLKVGQLGWQVIKNLGRAGAAGCAANESCRNAAEKAIQHSAYDLVHPATRLQPGITALGNHADTEWVSQNLPYVRTLVNATDWSVKLNIKWLDGAIRRGDEIWLVTNPDTWVNINPNSFYFQELRYLVSTGYKNVVNMFGE